MGAYSVVVVVVVTTLYDSHQHARTADKHEATYVVVLTDGCRLSVGRCRGFMAGGKGGCGEREGGCRCA